jgi:hypothetical protein
MRGAAITELTVSAGAKPALQCLSPAPSAPHEPSIGLIRERIQTTSDGQE